MPCGELENESCGLRGHFCLFFLLVIIDVSVHLTYQHTKLRASCRQRL